MTSSRLTVEWHGRLRLDVHDVTDGLATGSSGKVLAGSQQIIRFGNSSPEVWYYRAAGFLLAGNDEQAIGAVRIAAGMESEQVYSYYQSRRFRALNDFKGTFARSWSEWWTRARRSVLFVRISRRAEAAGPGPSTNWRGR